MISVYLHKKYIFKYWSLINLAQALREWIIRYVCILIDWVNDGINVDSDICIMWLSQSRDINKCQCFCSFFSKQRATQRILSIKQTAGHNNLRQAIFLHCVMSRRDDQKLAPRGRSVTRVGRMDEYREEKAVSHAESIASFD